MPKTHQITCAHDDCEAWSHTAAFQPADYDRLAADHRAQLAADGWTDVEGRDYCPTHPPAARSAAV
ncbi:hypothetical protein [Streptomyces sp. NPDC003720]|uniref:hypothetical protein n=1 Tax=Streptomyces sp. NPDC003720 TaxID=3364684 RepID=UPI0036AFC11F